MSKINLTIYIYLFIHFAFTISNLNTVNDK